MVSAYEFNSWRDDALALRRGSVKARRYRVTQLRLWPRNPVTLNVLDADFPERLEDFFGFDALGDGLEADDMTDLVYRGYDRAIYGTRGNSADERAIDF